MAVYPIKMLKDEGNNPFVPLVGTNAIVDAQGQSLDDKFATKLEAVNIIAGENITLQKVGNNITINGGAGSSVSLIDNLTTATPGLGALDARQGKALKDLIPAVINNLNSTSTTSALSAYQGYLLKNRVVPAGGTTGQVLKKSSNADNAVEWGDNITVENNLTSTSTTNALSAAQGKVLNNSIQSLTNNVLLKNNTASFTPTSNYHPATKKYVDDKFAVTTDYIVDRSTNGNWNYIKWNSGLLEVKGFYTFNGDINQAEGAVYYGDCTIALPTGVILTTPTHLQISVVRSGGYGTFYTAGTVSTSQIKGWLFADGANTGVTATVYVNFNST